MSVPHKKQQQRTLEYEEGGKNIENKKKPSNLMNKIYQAFIR